MNWLVDTNVISEARRVKPSDSVRAWFTAVPGSTLFTSEVNLAELVYGAGKAADVLRQREILDWIELSVRPMFVGRIIPVSEGILVRWRIITRERNLAGTPAPAFDLLIAAAAIELGLSVCSRDTLPFVACGIPTLNPFTGERFNGA